eukprot:jgi/Bigna1/84476/fgenesh1_pg.141_\
MSAATQGLTQKVNRLLSSNVSIASAGMVSCLNGVLHGPRSEFVPKGGNTLAARRQLQHQLEAKDLQHCKELLERFSPVSKVFEATERILDDLNATVEAASERVKAARKSSGSLVERASKLEEEKKIIQSKSKVVNKLLSQFQLQAHHSKALESNEVDENMLDAIERINEIRDNLPCPSCYQRVGLDMIESLAKRQERAYRVLFHWTQKHVQSIAENTGGALNPIFTRGLELLKQRPAYFSHCLDMVEPDWEWEESMHEEGGGGRRGGEGRPAHISVIKQQVANARRIVMIKRFIAALCRGGPNGQPRPIEIHAGDPIRYVSDMLAWVHQAVAMEREFLLSLITTTASDGQRATMPRQGHAENLDSKRRGNATEKEEVGGGGGGDVKSEREKEEDQQAQLISSVSRVLEGLARPLSVRVEQSLVFQPSTVLSYNLRSTIDFYYRTLRPLVVPTGVFAKAVQALVEKAQATFEKLVETQIKQLSEAAAPYTNDLSPPEAIQTVLDQVSSLVKVHEGCLVPAEHKDHAFIPILEKLVAAIRKGAEASAEGLDGANRSVFQLNILCALEMALQSPEPRIRDSRSKISAEIKAKLGGLVRTQADAFLEKSGLRNIYRAASEARDKKIKLSEVKGTQMATVSKASLQKELGRFYTYLVGISTLLTPEIDRVGDPWIRVTTREGVGLIVSESYKIVHSVISDPSLSGLGEGEAAVILRHTPEHVKTLLDL